MIEQSQDMDSGESSPTTPITSPSGAAREALQHLAFSSARSGSLLKQTYGYVLEKRLESAAMAPRTQNKPSGALTLMGLPAELKLDIFDHLIRPGDVYVRWSPRAANHDVRFTHLMQDWDTVPDPNAWLMRQPRRRVANPTHVEMALFGVCKQLRDEAMQYFLYHNTFHVMGKDFTIPYLNWGLYPPRDSHIRRLSIAFDHRSCDIGHRMALFISERQEWMDRRPTATLDDWRTHLHEELEWELQHICWMPLVCQVHQLNLRYLEVNVQNCTCPCGCQDLLAWAMGWLCDWEGEPPQELVISGTRSVAERREIRRIVENPLREEHLRLSFDKCIDLMALPVAGVTGGENEDA